MNNIGPVIMAVGLGAIALYFYADSRDGPPRPTPILKPGPAETRAAPKRPVAITTTTAPCALDRSATAMMLDAMRRKDSDALEGLLDRKKILSLAKGTAFQTEDEEHGISWGFVNSGRNMGEACYVLTSLLSEAKNQPH